MTLKLFLWSLKCNQVLVPFPSLNFIDARPKRPEEHIAETRIYHRRPDNEMFITRTGSAVISLSSGVFTSLGDKSEKQWNIK